MGIVYCTREDVASALDVKATARRDAQLDRCIEAGSRAVDGLTHRVFFPEFRTMTFDWPDRQSPTSWRLWLDKNELISATTLTAAGQSIPDTDFFLRPDDGPPFNRVEINLGGHSGFAAGDTTQRAIGITGWYGGCPDIQTDAGALAAAVDASQTTLDVTDPVAVGVGTLLRIDDERIVVTGKTWTASGQTIQADLVDKNNAGAVTVTDGTAFVEGELLLIGGERVQVRDIAGNTLTVDRAVDGSTLTAHTSDDAVFWRRRCMVLRGQLGTAPGPHSADPLHAQVYPPLVRQLAIGEALVALGQETGGYAYQIRAGESAAKFAQSIQDLRDTVYTKHARKARSRAV
ncbi:hypothetical protein [Amycolatopsis sp. NPDC004378]